MLEDAYPANGDQGAAPMPRAIDGRSLLSTVRAIFTLTMEVGGCGEDITHHFLGRLDSLARCATNRPADAARGVDLEQLFREELRAFRFGDDPRISIAGAEMRLSLEPALWIALAVHELVTNAIKFGTLGDDCGKGRLSICWETGPTGLTIGWHEAGIAVIAPAAIRYGFGRALIEEMLPARIGADCDFRIIPGEINCILKLPRNVLA